MPKPKPPTSAASPLTPLGTLTAFKASVVDETMTKALANTAGLTPAASAAAVLAYKKARKVRRSLQEQVQDLLAAQVASANRKRRA